MDVTVGQVVWCKPSGARQGVGQVVEVHSNGMMCVDQADGRFYDMETDEVQEYTGVIAFDWFNLQSFPLPENQQGQLVNQPDIPYPRGAQGQGLAPWLKYLTSTLVEV